MSSAQGLNEIDARIAALEAQLAAGSESDGSSDGDDVPAASVEAAASIAEGKQAELSSRRKRKREMEQLHGKASAAGPPVLLRCELCNVSVNSELLMREHCLGRRHRELEVEMRASAEGRWCPVCKLEFTSTVQLDEHKRGKRHKEAAERAERPGVGVSFARGGGPSHRGIGRGGRGTSGGRAAGSARVPAVPPSRGGLAGRGRGGFRGRGGSSSDVHRRNISAPSAAVGPQGSVC